MKKNIFKKVWTNLQSKILSNENIPLGVCALLRTNYEAIYDANKLEVDGQTYEFTYENKEITSSYIDFVKEQIALKPRGVEWNNILQSRLNALESYIGHKLLLIDIHSPLNQIYIRVDLNLLKIVHWEIIRDDEMYCS